MHRSCRVMVSTTPPFLGWPNWNLRRGAIPLSLNSQNQSGDWRLFSIFFQPTELAHLHEFPNTAIEQPPSGPAAAKPAVLKPGVHAAMSLRLAYVVLPWQIPA